MASKWRILSLCVVSASLFFGGCGGGGSPSAGGGTPTPTPSPTPSPTPTQGPTLTWQKDFAPQGSSSITGMTFLAGTVLGVGLENNSGNTATIGFDVTVNDLGATATASGKNFFPDTPSSATGVALTNSGTALAIGTHTLPGGSANAPAAFALNPATGALLPGGEKSFSCPSGAQLPTAITTDPTTGTVYIAFSVIGGLPAIVTSDASGNANCAIASIQVSDAGPNGSITDLKVAGGNLIVTGNLSGTTANSYVASIDKTNGARTWGVSGTGPFGGALMRSVVVDASGFGFVGGTAINGSTNQWVVVKLRLSDGSFATANGGWVVNPIPPAQTATADSLQALVPNTGTGGGVVAAGQTTPSGQSNPNSVQTAVAVINPDGSVRSKAQVNVFSGKQEHVNRAASDGAHALYVGGTGFTPGVGNSNFAWIAKFNIP